MCGELCWVQVRIGQARRSRRGVVSYGRVGHVRAWNGGHGWQRGARFVRARLGQAVKDGSAGSGKFRPGTAMRLRRGWAR